MSTRYEWGSLAHPFIGLTFVPKGKCAKGHDPDDQPIGAPSFFDGCDEECLVSDEAAIVLSFDDAMVIEGSLSELRDFARWILRETQEADNG